MTDYLTLAVVLFVCGIILFLAEYLLPTGGFLLVAGMLVCVVGVGVVAVYGDTREIVASLILLGVGVPLAATGLMYVWGTRMAIRSDELPVGNESPPVIPGGYQDLEQLLGRYGRTISPMRPSGTVDFDGRRVDAMSEGVMLDEDIWVKCVEVRAGKVIVRQVPKPADLENLDLDELNS